MPLHSFDDPVLDELARRADNATFEKGGGNEGEIDDCSDNRIDSDAGDCSA